MRLTLRTLLAYLDDVLEAPDALELSKKIDESKFATELVHRIRSSVRKLRLDAPKLDGKGMGLDPNTVAEYLDSTLPADRVPDFEKVCLESDRHLAEVASCHQVLAIVLGEPAHVDAALRERVYRIGTMSNVELEQVARLREQFDAEPASPPQARVDENEPVAPPKTAAVVPPVEPVSRPKPEVPDYLREPSRRRVWPIALTLLLAFLGGLGILRLMGPLDATHPLAGMLGMGERQVVVNVPDAKVADGIGGLPVVPVEKEGGDSTANPGHSGADPNAGFKPALDAPAAPMNPEVVGNKNPPKPLEDGSPKVEVPRPNNERELPPVPMKDPEKPSVLPGPNENIPGIPVPGNPDIKDPAKVATLPTEKGSKPGTLPAVPGSDRAPPPPKPGIAPTTEVGRLSSADQVVAQVDEGTGLWRRLPRGATLTSNELYVVLPTYRPLISLKSGVQIMFAGESTFALQSSGAMDDAGVAIAFGRAVITTAGRAGASVSLNLGVEKGIATFGDADSELAVEVRRYLPPGSDPEREPGMIVSQFYVTRGRIDWQSTDGSQVSMNAGQVRVMMTGQPVHTTRIDAEPVWLDSKNISKVDRDASLELEGFLTTDKALALTLSEKTEYRKTEIRSLAARCLATLQEYEAVLRELNDDRQYSYWGPALESLRDAIARSPESAVILRRTLERLRLEDGATMYRIICDYGPQQLEAGGAKNLVAYLDHKALDVRVLAFETLRKITGFTQSYRPDWSPERRKLPYQKWTEKLREGLIVYKTLPSPIPERKIPLRPAIDEPAPAVLP